MTQILTYEDIKKFNNDGAILLKDKFKKKWIVKLRSGIKNAKINTLGERVEDFFILESDKPNALSNLEQLKTNIHNQIQNVGKKQLQSNPA